MGDERGGGQSLKNLKFRNILSSQKKYKLTNLLGSDKLTNLLGSDRLFHAKITSELKIFQNVEPGQPAYMYSVIYMNLFSSPQKRQMKI